jgi:hypothetical protein
MMAAPDEADAIATILKAAGLMLSAERVQKLLPAAVRLREAARWVNEHDLDWIEPALVFDPQERESVADGR